MKKYVIGVILLIVVIVLSYFQLKSELEAKAIELKNSPVNNITIALDSVDVVIEVDTIVKQDSISIMK